MSVYFIRHQHLVKIGYSSNLGARVRQIMGDIAGEPVFVGHMPGERDMERHLHHLFASSRFAGEWFVEIDAIKALEALILDPEMPGRNDPMQEFSRRIEANDATDEMSKRLRFIAARRWPDDNHKDRICRLREVLGWSHRRVRCLYGAEPGANVRQVEADQVTELETELRSASRIMADAEAMSPVPLAKPIEPGESK